MYAAVPTIIPARVAVIMPVASGADALVDFGEAEVGELRVAAAADQHVLRLDIAMKNRGVVSRRQSIGDA